MKTPKAFDLFSLVQTLTKSKGLNPLEYSQSLREASNGRRGASSIIRKDGIGIDLVYQEIEAMFPWMFNSLDEFVEALEERLGRKKGIADQYDPEAGTDQGNRRD